MVEEHARAVFQLVNETQTFKKVDDKSYELRMLVVTPLSLEEADMLLCRLGYCRQGATKQ